MKLASIEKIHSFETHPNADSLVKAKVLEWPVCVRKGEFFEGELIIFIFPDVIVDETNPQFEFMRSRKFRVWQATFRGEPSAGLVQPLSLLNYYVTLNEVELTLNYQEGCDVSEIIKAKKYERPSDLTLRCDCKGNFPNELISITDEDNLLSNPKTINEFLGKECVITTKWDGSSWTGIFNNGEYDVCSRRLKLKDTEGNVYWNISKRYDIENKLRTLGKNIAIQGELCGPKMNGNIPKLKEHELFVFNIKDLDTGKYFDNTECEELINYIGLKSVPIIKEFTWTEETTIKELQEIANNVKYDGNISAEGIVIRTKKMTYSPTLRKMLSVKLINQNYK